MRKNLKAVALLLSVIVFAGILAGCSQKDQSSSASETDKAAETQQTDSNSEQKGNESKGASQEVITLRILKGKAATEVPYEQMEMFKITSLWHPENCRM